MHNKVLHHQHHMAVQVALAQVPVARQDQTSSLLTFFAFHLVLLLAVAAIWKLIHCFTHRAPVARPAVAATRPWFSTDFEEELLMWD